MSRSTRPIPFFRPSVSRTEEVAVLRVLRSGWLTTGPEALRFEQEFADFISPRGDEPGSRLETISVNSATAGLHLALEAIGVGPGDSVAVPTLTFTATAEVVRYLGADPVFIDSDPADGNMSTEQLRRIRRELLETGRDLKAVIPVHLAGRPCRIGDIRSVVDPKTRIVEDSAHAFPSRTAQGMAGTLGDIGVFSFYATKTITTGEGGMVVTADRELAVRMRLMRLHGIDRVIWNRYKSEAGSKAWEYDVRAPGYKYNMTDLAAAIGRVQLTRADRFLTQRRLIAERYIRSLRDTPGIELPEDSMGHAWHLFIIRLRDGRTRDELAGALHRDGIGTSVHFIPLHRMSYWKDTYALDPAAFPVADDIGARCLSLPLWPGMNPRQVNRVTAAVRSFFNG